MLHFRLRFDEGVLNVVVVYGISSPLENAVKAHLNTALANDARHVLQEKCAGEATLFAADTNTVRDPTDRASGKLTYYDDNADALWRVLEASGFTDNALGRSLKSPVPSFAPPRCSRRRAARFGLTRTRASARARSDSERRVSTEQVGATSALASKART
jgi:hypothetical protein